MRLVDTKFSENANRSAESLPAAPTCLGIHKNIVVLLTRCNQQIRDLIIKIRGDTKE